MIEAEGYKHFGFTPLEKPFSLALYEAWLAKGYSGEMEYLERHLPFKQDPTKLMAQAKSAIVIAFDYVTHPKPVEEFPLREAKVARYAKGEDYHYWIKEKLEALISRLKTEFPDAGFACYTDSAPVLERDLAYRAGIGWVGKNTCVIHPKRGSLFLLGEIYTTLEADVSAEAMHDFCGTCTRCIDVCPTGALVAPRELDARKCISYLTIESRAVPAVELQNKIDGWFFGCDLCQTVCPWNIKVHGDLVREPSVDTGDRARLIEEMRMILTTSNSQLEKMFRGTPLSRAGGFGLKRNALLVCMHFGLRELEADVRALVEHPKLGGLALQVAAVNKP